MSKHSVSVIAKNLGLQSHGRIAFGELGNIFVTVYNQTYTASLTILANQLSANQFSAICSFLSDNRKRLLIKDAPLHQAPYLTILMDSHYGALTAKRVIHATQEIAAFLNALAVTSACANCGSTKGAAALTSDGALCLCDVCFDASKQELQENQVQRENTGSYISGLLGAVVGGMLGLIPWIILGLIGIFASASGLIMAWLCVLFYTKFHGRIARPMVPIIILVLLVFTIGGIFSFWMVSCLLDGNNFATAMMIILDDMTITGIPGDIILGLFLAGVGAFFTLRNVFQNTSSKNFTLIRPL